MEQCQKCKFYEGNYCHRFPQIQRKNADDFCGEYQQRPKEEETKKE